MPPTASNVWRMADRLAGGQLWSVIEKQRGAGSSLNDIARLLHDDYGIEVTGQTIANWLNSES